MIQVFEWLWIHWRKLYSWDKFFATESPWDIKVTDPTNSYFDTSPKHIYNYSAYFDKAKREFSIVMTELTLKLLLNYFIEMNKLISVEHRLILGSF